VNSRIVCPCLDKPRSVGKDSKPKAEYNMQKPITKHFKLK
jgi:hypothetical protein